MGGAAPSYTIGVCKHKQEVCSKWDPMLISLLLHSVLNTKGGPDTAAINSLVGQYSTKDSPGVGGGGGGGTTYSATDSLRGLV